MKRKNEKRNEFAKPKQHGGFNGYPFSRVWYLLLKPISIYQTRTITIIRIPGFPYLSTKHTVRKFKITVIYIREKLKSQVQNWR